MPGAGANFSKKLTFGKKQRSELHEESVEEPCSQREQQWKDPGVGATLGWPKWREQGRKSQLRKKQG